MSEEKAKPNRKLREVEFVAAEYNRLDSIAYPERGTTLAEMLHPEYWANVSGPGEEDAPGKKLRVWHRIEVRPADRAWTADLLVIATGPFTAKVVVREGGHQVFDGRAADAPLTVPTGYDVKHRGKNGWCVVRKSDGQPLKEGLDSQRAAVLWAEHHVKTFAQG